MSLDAVLAFLGVVQLQIRLAIAGRSSHVRINHGQPHLVHIVLRQRRESGPILTLGPAVNIDQHGAAFFGRGVTRLERDRPESAGRRTSGIESARA